jgi:MATE family multidrug resistance protein
MVHRFARPQGRLAVRWTIPICNCPQLLAFKAVRLNCHRSENSVSTTLEISAHLDERIRRRNELRSVIQMSVPIVITTCSRMVMDVADFTMISRLGPSAQGAILPGQITIWTIMVLGMGSITMVSTFVSQSLGRERFKETGSYAWQGIYLSFLYGAAALAFLPFLSGIFDWVNHSPDIRALEITYARIALLSIGPTIAGEALASFFNGIHKPKVTMWTAIEANVLNIGISMLLIFGYWGMPKLGIAGAIWGTVIGVSYRFARLLAVFLSHEYAQKYGTRRMWRPDAEKIRGIIRVGLPQGLQWTSDVMVWALFINILVGRTFGDVHLIASNVAWQYLRIAFMPAIGVGIALTALVGKAIGKGDHNQAMRVARMSAMIMAAYMLALAPIYLIFRETLIGWFNVPPEVVRIASGIMVCAVIFQFSDGMGIAYNAALRGAGDTFWPAVLFIVCHWSILIGGGWLVTKLRPQWGSLGPWWVATFLIVILGFVLWWRWRSQAWRKINVFRDDRPPGELVPAPEAV